MDRRLSMVFLMVCVALGSCSDDPTTPKEPSRADLPGDWELHSIIVGTDEQVLPDGNSFYYFTDTGAMCSLWRNAYDAYTSGRPGEVLQGLFVLREYDDEEFVDWQLRFLSTADTLVATVIQPSPSGIDGMVLYRVTDAPEPTCFEEAR